MPLARGLAARFLVLVLLFAGTALAVERPRLRVDSYVINAELNPKTHHLRAQARISFTALDDISAAVFDLHNDLRPELVTDSSGEKLDVERISADNVIRITLAQPVLKDASATLNIQYEGELASADDSPVDGLKVAYIGEDISYLLYPGRWFPVNGYGINRFTAKINVALPVGYTVVGSRQVKSAEFSDLGVFATNASPSPAGTAPMTAAQKLAAKRAAAGQRQQISQPFPTPGYNIYCFDWDKPSFPGSIIAGHFLDTASGQGGASIHVYFTPLHKQYAQAFADTASKEMEYFSAIYGAAPSGTLNVVEIPDDTVPSAWAPEIAAIAARAITSKVDYRLLANSIAHQWWGVSVSPANSDDVWLRDGFARYSEALYVESAAGKTGMQQALKEIAVGALAYDNIPLASVGKLDPFSPEAQSLATEKGAMILSMLRWVIGDAAFDNTLRIFALQHAGKTASAEEFRKIAEEHYGKPLDWFFTEWLDSTGAPEFKNKFTVYRIRKGFRVTGAVSQDLDLFRMPIELKIETDGKPETQKIDVSGTESPYTVETFGLPRHIVIDPDDRVLKNSTEYKLRVAILRGQQLEQQGDLAAALQQLQKALDYGKLSSLAHYRIAEVFYLQHNYQAAADEYRSALNGDGDPAWTEVWCHVQLGKIFDASGQRERASNEYRKALETNDNTAGALDEARKYLQKPFTRDSKSG